MKTTGKDNLSALEPAPSAPVAEPAPVAWHPMTDLPETGSKFVALYDDGSGAALWFRHDGGYIDANGNDADRLNGYEKWAYLPAGFEFWCEGLGEPVELPKWGGPAALAQSAAPVQHEPAAWPSGFFHLSGDARLRECVTQGCGQHVSIRIERDGVGSDHCEPCARKIAEFVDQQAAPSGEGE